MFSLEIPADWPGPFMLTLARVGGLMVFAPFLGSAAVSPVIRIALSITLSVVLFPVVQGGYPPMPQDSVSLILLLAGELGIGLLLGLVGQLFLGALELSGQLIGFQMGFSLINVIDPQTQVESSALSVLQTLIGILVFLSIDGHHWFIQAIVDSYQIIPQSAGYPSTLVEELIHVSAEMFVLGFKLAAPIVMVLIIVDILLGIIGRVAPQIHILIVGMPMKSLMGFIFMVATVHVFVPFLARHMQRLHEEIYMFLGIMGK